MKIHLSTKEGCFRKIKIKNVYIAHLPLLLYTYYFGFFTLCCVRLVFVNELHSFDFRLNLGFLKEID